MRVALCERLMRVAEGIVVGVVASAAAGLILWHLIGRKPAVPGSPPATPEQQHKQTLRRRLFGDE